MQLCNVGTVIGEGSPTNPLIHFGLARWLVRGRGNKTAFVATFLHRLLGIRSPLCALSRCQSIRTSPCSIVITAECCTRQGDRNYLPRGNCSGGIEFLDERELAEVPGDDDNSTTRDVYAPPSAPFPRLFPPRYPSLSICDRRPSLSTVKTLNQS